MLRKLLTWGLLNHVVFNIQAERMEKFSHHHWEKAHQPSKDEEISWVLGVEPENDHILSEKFESVSSPLNMDYGNFLSKNHVNALSAPASTTLNSLNNWLKDVSISYSPNTNTVLISSTVHEIEKILNTTIHIYRHVSHRKRILRTSEDFHIPDYIAPHISFTSINTPPIPLTSRNLHMSEIKYGKKQKMTPQTLRDLYGIPPDLVVKSPKTTQSVAEFFDESWKVEDLKEFNSRYNLSWNKLPINEGNRNMTNPTGESSLDLQYITGLAPNATTYVWNMKGTNPHSSIDEPFLAWAENILNKTDPPLVHSISYSDDEMHMFQIAKGYVKNFDRLLQKMAIRGITIIFSSGDDGVSGLRHRQFNATVKQACNVSGPQWPSSSPYVTSVGATQFLNIVYQDNDLDDIYYFSSKSEVVCSSTHNGVITSGGGFSNQYNRPNYQEKLVEKYIASESCPKITGFFNKAGRGYPDVSAFGTSYQVVVNGGTRSISGTSASAPTFAAMVSLWNDQRILAGKKPLGFLNPLLYIIGENHPEAFNDVVIGNNGASNDGSYVCETSFFADVGWDATSGLGTPKFDVLYNLTFDAETILQRNNGVIHKIMSQGSDVLFLLFLGLGWIVLIMAFSFHLIRRCCCPSSYKYTLIQKDENSMESSRTSINGSGVV